MKGIFAERSGSTLSEPTPLLVATTTPATPTTPLLPRLPRASSYSVAEHKHDYPHKHKHTRHTTTPRFLLFCSCCTQTEPHTVQNSTSSIPNNKYLSFRFKKENCCLYDLSDWTEAGKHFIGLDVHLVEQQTHTVENQLYSLQCISYGYQCWIQSRLWNYF